MKVMYPTCFSEAYPNGEAREEVTATRRRGKRILREGIIGGADGADREE